MKLFSYKDDKKQAVKRWFFPKYLRFADPLELSTWSAQKVRPCNLSQFFLRKVKWHAGCFASAKTWKYNRIRSTKIGTIRVFNHKQLQKKKRSKVDLHHQNTEVDLQVFSDFFDVCNQPRSSQCQSKEASGRNNHEVFSAYRKASWYHRIQSFILLEFWTSELWVPWICTILLWYCWWKKSQTTTWDGCQPYE